MGKFYIPGNSCKKNLLCQLRTGSHEWNPNYIAHDNNAVYVAETFIWFHLG